MQIIGRVGAMIFGLVGTIIAAIVNILYSIVHHAIGALGDSGLDRAHGGIGFLLVVIGVVGSFTALVAPQVAAVLLLIAGFGMFFIVKGYALFSIMFFVVAALLAFFDRSTRRTTA
jgi:hypothetical protein